MKKLTVRIYIFVLLEMLLISLISSYRSCANTIEFRASGSPKSDTVKQAAFQVLKTKCNICHKKKNPFMVFNYKNMDRRATKIYLQVFKKKRMPKGDEIKLSEAEYQTLKNWLNTQNIL